MYLNEVWKEVIYTYKFEKQIWSFTETELLETDNFIYIKYCIPYICGTIKKYIKIRMKL